MPRRADTPELRERNRIYQNAWYHANKGSALATRKNRTAKQLDAVREYKANRGCERCGEKHFACLEFHHPDPSTKEVNPQDLVRAKGWTLQRIFAELGTMQVLCANCHRKLHHEWFLATGSRLIAPQTSDSQ
jgi:hypothetical protein